jgi:hypothetical protein
MTKLYQKFAEHDYPRIYKEYVGILPSTNKKKDYGFSGRVDRYLKSNYEKWDDIKVYSAQKKLYEHFCFLIGKDGSWLNGQRVDVPNISRFAQNIDAILKSYREKKTDGYQEHKEEHDIHLPDNSDNPIIKKITSCYPECIHFWFSSMGVEENGKRIVFKAVEPFYRDWVNKYYKTNMEKILGKEVVVE